MFARSVLGPVTALALFLCTPLTVLADQAVLLGERNLRSDHPMWGGLSAIEMLPGGQDMLVLSDRGALIRAALYRDETGQVRAVGEVVGDILSNQQGERGNRGSRDSEGLALASDGTIYISFEGDHRVSVYYGEGETVALPVAAEFAALQPNSSLESLAIDAHGRLFTLPERSGEWDRPFPIYRFGDGQWDSEMTLPRNGRFLPVGADFDDLGRFYLLERDFNGFFGFASRIRRFDVVEGMFTNEATLLETSHGRHSNLEGISLWRDAQGRLIASLISDDNFSPFLPNQLVEYHLPEE